MNQKPNTPLRLIFHVGDGKTGSSSIQHVLNTHQKELKNLGFWYLGLMLENAESVFYPWQKMQASEDFHQMDDETAQTELTKVFQAVVDHAQNNNLHTLIWSNESFFRRHGKVIPVLKLLNIEISIVAYVRRHDAWAKSAYVQWGIKHKTNAGPVLAFEKWLEKNKKLLNFSEYLNEWIKVFNDGVLVRNIDNIGDSVVDFMKIIQLDPNDFKIERKNESPSAEELLIRALFNDKFSQAVLPVKFNQIFLDRAGWLNLTVDEFIASLMPTQDEIDETRIAAQEDRLALDQILVKNGQNLIDISPIISKPLSVNNGKLLLNLSRIVVDQSLKIQALQSSIDKLNEQKSSGSVPGPTSSIRPAGQEQTHTDQPVFLISTGRSGSTLVQRLLNCHLDLVVWGEHHGFLKGFAAAYEQMSIVTPNLYPRTPSENKGPSILLPTLSNPAAPIEWVNPWSLEEFSLQIKNFINSYFDFKLSAGQRWGFKEILYCDMATLNMLHEIYPLGKFVFIQRDVIDTVHSKVLAFVKVKNWQNFSDQQKIKKIKNLLDSVKMHHKVHENFVSKYGDAGIIVDYKNITAYPDSVIKEILDHLNLDRIRFNWNLSNEIMKKILSKTEKNEELLDLIYKVYQSDEGVTDV